MTVNEMRLNKRLLDKALMMLPDDADIWSAEIGLQFDGTGLVPCVEVHLSKPVEIAGYDVETYNASGSVYARICMDDITVWWAVHD